MGAAPYARIVEDVKRRVAEGRLRPGERVPSTRQLARDWGVALATAAKALSVLAQEGVVVAEPRVGTVVAQPRARQGRRDAGRGEVTAPTGGVGERDLARARIVRAAIELADAEGLGAVTMRAVAARLGAATMSLYRHVGGKDDLVMLMVDEVLDRFPLPRQPPDGWRARLEAAARAQWAAYRAHPWMAGVTSLTRPLPSPSLLRHTEWALSALDGTGLDATSRMHVHILLYSYVQGIAANLERETRDRASTGLTGDEWMHGQEDAIAAIAGSGGYPAFAAAVAELGGDFDLDLDVLFEFGLAPLLDGLATVIGEAAGGAGRSGRG